jgi:hypothetical protein
MAFPLAGLRRRTGAVPGPDAPVAAGQHRARAAVDLNFVAAIGNDKRELAVADFDRHGAWRIALRKGDPRSGEINLE